MTESTPDWASAEKAGKIPERMGTLTDQNYWASRARQTEARLAHILEPLVDVDRDDLAVLLAELKCCGREDAGPEVAELVERAIKALDTAR